MTNDVVVGDIHGHRTELRELLTDLELVDSAGDWAGGRRRLWLLGDYVDRGPDGIGVIDDVRRWESQAAESGGAVRPLLGNHEVQLLAAYLFDRTPVAALGALRDFHTGWLRFGGQENDLARLTDEHLAWLRALPAVAVANGHLLMHSDTDRYAHLGATVDEVNRAVAAVLAQLDLDAWIALCEVMSHRGAFRDDAAVDALLERFGAHTVVHGHSTLIDAFGIAPGDVKEPLTYASGRVTATDGGVFQGGRILATTLSAR